MPFRYTAIVDCERRWRPKATLGRVWLGVERKFLRAKTTQKKVQNSLWKVKLSSSATRRLHQPSTVNHDVRIYTDQRYRHHWRPPPRIITGRFVFLAGGCFVMLHQILVTLEPPGPPSQLEISTHGNTRQSYTSEGLLKTPIHIIK